MCGSEDGKAYVYSLQSKQVVQVLEGHSAPVVAVDCHPSEPIIATAALSPDNTVKLWRAGA